MTGGSVRNQGSGVSANNAGSSIIKDFILSSSRRLSSSALQLSVFDASTIRIHEDVTLASQTESSFIDLAPPTMTFVTNKMEPPGRLRTSSLTLDVSTNSRKDVDSGNSSLIDSSSADSYHEFGSGSRSRTTSSSKSDQSLTSLNQTECQMGCHRKRHSSVSDSNSGSSEKVSFNASDITGTCEEYSASGENKGMCPVSSKMFVCEDINSDLESQPFLYLSSADALQSCDLVGQYRSYSGIHDSTSVSGSPDDCCGYPARKCAIAFSSAVAKGNNNHIPDESFLDMRTHFKRKGVHSLKRSYLRERGPLFDDYNTRFEKEDCALNMFYREPCKVPLRRSASLSNISKQRPDCLVAPQIPETSNVTSYRGQSPDLNSDSRDCFTTNCKPKSRPVPGVQAFSFANIQPHPSFKLHPILKEDSSQMVQSPQRQQQLHVTCANCTHLQPDYNITEIPLSSPQPQQIRTAHQDKLCSSYGCDCKSSFIPKNQHGHSTDPDLTTNLIQTHTPNSAQAHNSRYQGDCLIISCSPLSHLSSDISDAANSTSKFPVQNLESVLGHGTPASVSVLKRGLKPRKSAGDTPLQVLVPRFKMVAEEGNQTHMTTCMLEPCLDKAFLGNDDLRLQHNLQTTPSQFTNTSLNPFMFPNNFSASSHLASTLQGSFENPPSTCPGDNQLDIFFGNTDGEMCIRGLNKQIFDSGCGGTPVREGHVEDNVAEAPDLAMFDQLCNRRFVSPSASQYPISGSQSNGTQIVHSLPNRGCTSEPISSQTTFSMLDPFQSTRQSSPMNYSGGSPPLQGKFLNSHTSSPLPTKLQVTTKMYNGHDQLSVQHSANNLIEPPCQLCHLKTVNQNTSSHDNHNHQGTADQGPTDDSGYQSNMVLRVPKACFVADFLDTHQNLHESRRGSIELSEFSSLVGGHDSGNDGSLQRSGTSQLGLLKSTSAVPGHYEYLSRDLPDYTYLCLAATFLNPVLGLAALICNHYARRHLRMRRRTHANNLYFATIVLSTVAIFLTLIGGALLIAHKIVLRAEKNDPIVVSSSLDCEDTLRGLDSSFQSFFNIDLPLFCELTKNRRVMEALKNFILKDIHFRNPKQNGSIVEREWASAGERAGLNSTNEDVGLMDIQSEEMEGGEAINGTFPFSMNVGNEFVNRNSDAQSPGKGVFLPLPENDTSNNSASQFVGTPGATVGLKEEHRELMESQGTAKLNGSAIAVHQHTVSESDGGIIDPISTGNTSVSR